MFPTFFVFSHECIAKGWDHRVRLGTPLFLNGFSCPQPPSEVGTRLGPPGRLGQRYILVGRGGATGTDVAYGGDLTDAIAVAHSPQAVEAAFPRRVGTGEHSATSLRAASPTCLFVGLRRTYGTALTACTIETYGSERFRLDDLGLSGKLESCALKSK